MLNYVVIEIRVQDGAQSAPPLSGVTTSKVEDEEIDPNKHKFGHRHFEVKVILMYGKRKYNI